MQEVQPEVKDYHDKLKTNIQRLCVEHKSMASMILVDFHPMPTIPIHDEIDYTRYLSPLRRRVPSALPDLASPDLQARLQQLSLQKRRSRR